MNIHLKYSLTTDDLFEYHRARVKIWKELPPDTRPKSKWRTFIYWAALAGIGVLMFVFRDRLSPPRSDPPSNSPPDWYARGAAFLVLGVIIWGVFKWLRPSRSAFKRAFERNPNLSAREEVLLCDEHATFRTETSASVLVWTHFIRFVETRTLFVLVVSRDAANLIPKRAFASPQEIAEFRGFAQAHVGNTPVGFPVQGVGLRQSQADNENVITREERL